MDDEGGGKKVRKKEKKKKSRDHGHNPKGKMTKSTSLAARLLTTATISKVWRLPTLRSLAPCKPLPLRTKKNQRRRLDYRVLILRNPIKAIIIAQKSDLNQPIETNILSTILPSFEIHLIFVQDYFDFLKGFWQNTIQNDLFFSFFLFDHEAHSFEPHLSL